MPHVNGGRTKSAAGGAFISRVTRVSCGRCREVVDIRAGGMNAIKILSLVGKVAGVIAGLNVIPFVPPQYGLFIFAGASILKDVVNRVGDLVDDGKQNYSFKA